MAINYFNFVGLSNWITFKWYNIYIFLIICEILTLSYQFKNYWSYFCLWLYIQRQIEIDRGRERERYRNFISTIIIDPTWFCLAEVCSTAVRKPVGNVKADIQNTHGGRAVVAHLANCSTLWTRSRVHEAKGFIEGYA